MYHYKFQWNTSNHSGTLSVCMSMSVCMQKLQRGSRSLRFWLYPDSAISVSNSRLLFNFVQNAWTYSDDKKDKNVMGLRSSLSTADHDPHLSITGLRLAFNHPRWTDFKWADACWRWFLKYLQWFQSRYDSMQNTVNELGSFQFFTFSKWSFWQFCGN